MTDQPRILIADDVPDNVRLVQDLLTVEGYRVIPAYDGEEALRKIRQNPPDVILLDVNMPRVDGWEVCERLKADAATADIPVLMLTAWAEPDQRVRGLQLGAEDYLAKPFDHRELIARVRALLRRKQEADELRAAKQAIRQTFERFVSPAVVERLLADPSQVQLGGVQQLVTILLADLRGYTTLAEGLPPQQLVDILNGHLTVAAQAVLAHQGTISQFVGDMVMAIYNAPLPQPDHALRAARAALAVREGMIRYHATLPPELRMDFGIGIVTGEAMVGNIGAREMLNFSAIGDTVNLTQRLQEIARGSQIMISESARQAVGALAQVRSLGTIPIRGRNEPVAVYELLALKDQGAEP
jgi:adenylate cyclase